MAIVKHRDQRVVVLIDVQNLYYSARHLYGRKVNFKEILKTAVARRHLIRAIAYVVRTESGEEQPFFNALVRAGIETKVKDLQIFLGGAKKADWDVGISVDAIRLAQLVDTIVIISGDGDFIPLVEYLKNQGRQVEVASFGRSSSQKLKDVVDDFLDLGDEPERFLFKK
ncbi:MAG TPA: NYN domain-containing protein [Candidatus Portnoybacteria bacterium]|nr:NYN domain-containing protein [Candidatus Portnoybacteria bacterium]